MTSDSTALRGLETDDTSARGTTTTGRGTAATVLRLAPDLEIVYNDDPASVEELVVNQPIPSAVRHSDLAKRVFDIGVAGTALVLSAPVWVAVYTIASVSQEGPVLFSQLRIGRGGRMFRCLKFRTMRVDADAVLRQVLDSDLELARQWQEDQKLVADPRVTRLGRVLRRFDLDEIPQFLNVLRGDMSIVGPRPVVLNEASRFGETLPTVLSVRPGLTGAWQVSGRNETTYSERVEQEYHYVKTRSLLGDLAICIKTPLALLRRNGGR